MKVTKSQREALRKVLEEPGEQYGVVGQSGERWLDCLEPYGDTFLLLTELHEALIVEIEKW